MSPVAQLCCPAAISGHVFSWVMMHMNPVSYYVGTQTHKTCMCSTLSNIMMPIHVAGIIHRCKHTDKHLRYTVERTTGWSVVTWSTGLSQCLMPRRLQLPQTTVKLSMHGHVSGSGSSWLSMSSFTEPFHPPIPTCYSSTQISTQTSKPRERPLINIISDHNDILTFDACKQQISI